MTIDEAVAWCVEHCVDVSFDNEVFIYDALSSPFAANLLGRGVNLIEAVQDAIKQNHPYVR